MREKEFLKSVINNRNSVVYIWLFGWACEVTVILIQKRLLHWFLCDYFSDLTSPTSNQIPDMHIANSVVYDTFYKLFFTHASIYYLILHLYCDIKLSLLLL